VHVLTVEDSLEASMSQYLAERIHATENVQVHPHTTVAEVQGEDHLRRVILTDTETEERAEVATSALFVFIGATPRTRWLSDVLERDDDGFVCSGDGLGDAPGGVPDRDPFPLETRLPGVFVAGDVRAGSVKRVVSAAGEGAAAIQYVHRYLAAL
jgi:thioredoxin reductase (NADPH)